MNKNRLTSTQLEDFKSLMTHWQQRLGLQNWRIVYSPRKTNSMACITKSPEDRLAVYQVGCFGDEGVSRKTMEETAIHELLHVLFDPLIRAAWSREQTVTTEAEHAVIATLERLLGGHP